MATSSTSNTPTTSNNTTTNTTTITNNTHNFFPPPSHSITNTNLLLNNPNQLTNNLISSNKSIEKNNELLKLLALHALKLTVPLGNFTCNIINNEINFQARDENNFIQLSGHPGSLARASKNTLWKKYDGTPNNSELKAYEYFNSNKEPKLLEITPKFYALTIYNGNEFLELEDLTSTFNNSNCDSSDNLKIMDIKMGSRTFTETEVKNTKKRNDLFEKMIKIDPNSINTLPPSDLTTKSLTKLNYMLWRESTTTTGKLSFRIEGIAGLKNQNINCKKINNKINIINIFKCFLIDNNYENDETEFKNLIDLNEIINTKINIEITINLINRLKFIRNIIENSPFFQRHEIIGSSLLLLRNSKKASAYLIDFVKTIQLPTDENDENIIKINHRNKWILGNHEDGYLNGLDNLIQILEELII